MSDDVLLRSEINFLKRENEALRQTLRDEFAKAALIGLLSNHGDAGWHPDGEVQSQEGAALIAYEYADAMLEARKA